MEKTYAIHLYNNILEADYPDYLKSTRIETSFISQLESNSENKTMSSEKTSVNEEAVVETDCSQAAEKAITLATDLTAKVAELEQTNEKLLTEASENMKEQEKTVSDLQISIDELKSQLGKKVSIPLAASRSGGSATEVLQADE